MYFASALARYFCANTCTQFKIITSYDRLVSAR